MQTTIESKLPYSIAIIKPDAHEDILAEMITKEIEDNGLAIAHRKDMVLSLEQAEEIYAEHADRPYFWASVKSLQGEKDSDYATVFVVESNEGPCLAKLQAIKGRSDMGGIRLKYRLFSRKELEEKGLSGDKLTEELSKNRLHVPDTDEASKQLINKLLTDEEINELKERNPEFYKDLREIVKENKELKMLPPAR